MQKAISVYKPIGKTPLDCIVALKNKFPELKETKLAYAGRLDPMAEGLLLLLVGDECKKREYYQKLPKTYELSVLFGFETDTYDLLGKITSSSEPDVKKLLVSLSKEIDELKGTQSQKYPPYSSARVNGKPLFYWARNNLLSSINIPEKQITIKNVQLLDSITVSSKKLLQQISEKITLVNGDFRQEEILILWEEILKGKELDHLITTIEVSSSHGAYMRSLAHELGKTLLTQGCAYSIKRTSVGDFSIKDALTLFSEAQS
jgi:tRNA pseudouridine55 synthase